MKNRTRLTLSLWLGLTTGFCADVPAGKTQQLTSPDQVPQGLAKSDWASIRDAYEAGRHVFQPVPGQDGVWQARNPGQQWTTKFDGRGFVSEPKGGGWQWGLELKRYGFPGAARVISGNSKMKAEGQRLTYGWDPTLEEWFVNDRRGLEHGFTVKERPAGATDVPLQFHLAVRGSLTVKLAADGQGLLFCDTNGATVINYSGLKVWDADGKMLSSRFVAPNSRHPTLVTLLVEERNARYPLTIDPIAQRAYLKSINNGGAPEDGFGQSVSVSGDTVVVGAPFEDSSTTGVNSAPNEGAANAGAAYVFVRSGTTWSQQAYLKPAAVGTSQAGDNFGQSVSVSGETLVVGANGEDSSTMGVNSTPDESAATAGAAYVFVRNGTTWSQEAYLKPSAVGTAQADDQFGRSVSVAGNTVVVGAPFEDSSTTGVNSTPNESAGNSGAAYVFVRSGTTWSQQAYLKPAAVGTTQTSDALGWSVSVSGDTVVVGAPNERSNTTGVNSTPNESAVNSGGAYVFVRSGTTWSQQAYLKPAAIGTTQTSDALGWSVSVSGDTVVVGAPNERSNTTGVNSTPNESAGNSGAAYVFVRIGTTWSQEAYLKPAAVGTTQAGDAFGWSVSVSGDTVVVGAYLEDSFTSGVNSTPNDISFGSDSGAAYVFVRSGTTWSQQAYLKPTAPGANDQFGRSVSVSGDTVVIGIPNEDSGTTGVNGPRNENAADAGAAFVFVRSGTTWSQQVFLKASNAETSPGSNDQFGWSVSVSGDTVVVGAPNEDSGTTGVNSTPNESAADAGAAYVFMRSGTTWSQQAYLKPAAVGTSQANDAFGLSVAVSGDTVVVGARGEASSTTGVNSTPNESDPFSGAAYVFVRSGTTWSQQAYLKPAAVGASQFGNQFGTSVSVSGDTVIVGSPVEGSGTTGVNSTPDESASGAGAAYVFVRSGTTWSQQAYLKASNPGVNDNFGYSVTVSGDTAVVGAYFEDSNTTGVNSTPNESASSAGAAYVFVRSGTTWSQQAYLKPAAVGTSQINDNFGISVSVSGDTVVVGAAGEASSTTGVNSTPNESASFSGAAYVFVRSGTTWSEQAYLKPAAVGTSQAFDQFGTSVSVSGDTVVVGAFAEGSGTTGINSTPDESVSGSGAAYVFVRSGTTWSEQAYLKPAAVGTWGTDQFGLSVSVSGDTVVVGSPYEDSSTAGVNSTPDEGGVNSGAAYIFNGFPVPEIVVEQPAGTSLGDSTGYITFGHVPVSSSSNLTFTVTNSGSANLTGLAITKDGVNSGDFTVGSPGATTLAPAASTTFTVTFTPAAFGARTAAVHIASNDLDENPFDITLIGTGNTLPVAGVDLFNRGPNTALNITIASLITNDSDPDLDAIAITGFNLTSTNGVTLATNATTIFYTNNLNVNDQFTYTLTDALGGSVAGSVLIQMVPSMGSNTIVSLQVGVPGAGSNTLSFAGIPNYQYAVWFATNLTDSPWFQLTTTTGTNGLWTVIDGTATNAQRFYKVSTP